uniref:Succinate dehydrogenase assembly factor 3 n=1 Tax=Chloropicon primus TaxID=1764295 RepID=A0A7S2T1P4_9CHLO
MGTVGQARRWINTSPSPSTQRERERERGGGKIMTKTKEVLLRLYARILRLHRSSLPLPLRDMGDQYVRQEFRSMWNLKDADMEKHYDEFSGQWEDYAKTLGTAPQEGAGESVAERDVVSGDLKEETLKTLSDEQREQLKRLKDEIDGFTRPDA